MGASQTRESEIENRINDIEEEFESEDLVLYRFKNIDGVLYRDKLVSIVIVDSLPVYIEQLNHGDVFLLDVPSVDKIYVWVGQKSNQREKKKCIHIANKIKNESGSNKSSIVVIEGRNMFNSSYFSFYKQFKYKKGDKYEQIRSMNDLNRVYKNIGSDSSNKNDFNILERRIYDSRIYKLSEEDDDEGRTVISIVGASEPLSKSFLDSRSSFVIDVYDNVNIYIWSGNFASNSSRSLALLKAEEIMNRDLIDKNIERKIQWNMDDFEMWDFKEMFFDWMDNEWDENEMIRMKESEEVKKEYEGDLETFYDIKEEEEKNLTVEEESELPKSKEIESIKEDKIDSEKQIKEEEKEIKDISNKKEEEKIDIIKSNDNVETDKIKKIIKSSDNYIEEYKSKEKMSILSLDEESFKSLDKESVFDFFKSLKKQIPSSIDTPQTITSNIKSLLDAENEIESMINQTKSKKQRKKVLNRNLSAFVKNIDDLEDKMNIPASIYKSDLNDGENKHLLSYHKRVSAPTNRRKPTKQLVKKIEDLKSNQSKASEVRRANVGGSYGLLRTLGVDLELKKKTVKQNKGNTLSNFFYNKGDPRLIQVRGRRKIVIRQVEITIESLNSFDVFILDTGKSIIYQWNGKYSNRIEKGKAMDIIKNIKDKEYNGLSRVIILDEGKNDSTEKGFWSYLDESYDEMKKNHNDERMKKLKNNNYKKISEITQMKDSIDDIFVSSYISNSYNLYRIIEISNNSYEYELISKYPLKKELLNDNDCFILDCLTEIFIWCGKKSKINLRKNTLDISVQLYKIRDFWCSKIYRELPDGETVLFREKFSNWGYGPPIQMKKEVRLINNINQEEINIDDNFILNIYNSNNERHEIMIDIEMNGNIINIWRVNDFKKEMIKKEHYGHFYDQDSFLILYKYILKNKEKYIIYYWQGRYSSINEKGASALLTIDLEKEYQSAKEIRVVQGYEPLSFLNLFKNNNHYIVHNGKYDPNIKFNNDQNIILYEVSGYNNQYLRSFQVSPISQSLKSTCSFILIDISSKLSFIWNGKLSNDIINEFSMKCNESIHRYFNLSSHKNLIVLNEGKESNQFWKCLKSKNNSSSSHYFKLNSLHNYRLYHGSESTGQFNIFEIPKPLYQDDLSKHDCYILDTFDFIYIWYDQCSSYELQKSIEFSLKYIDIVPDSRDRDHSRVLLVKSGNEPLRFTSFFTAWSPTPIDIDGDLERADSYLAKFSTKYSYEDLVSRNFPQGLDLTKLENYLTDEEFEKVFNMTREEFEKFPIWKQQKEKRAKKLF